MGDVRRRRLWRCLLRRGLSLCPTTTPIQMASPEFLAGHSNLVTFNFFALLADPMTNYLRPQYRDDEYDAHPNELANRTIGPLFADFTD